MTKSKTERSEPGARPHPEQVGPRYTFSLDGPEGIAMRIRTSVNIAECLNVVEQTLKIVSEGFSERLAENIVNEHVLVTDDWNRRETIAKLTKIISEHLSAAQPLASPGGERK